MKYEVIVKSEAREDIKQAMAWYEEKSNGLGEEFVEVILDYATYLSTNAHTHPKVNGEYRELLVKKFPYVIVYRIVEDNLILILGVIHTMKHPASRKRKTIE